jgi:hypothetical protein
MSRHLTHPTAELFKAVARRVVYGIETGELTAPPEAQKKLRDLENKARQALEVAARRREVRS